MLKITFVLLALFAFVAVKSAPISDEPTSSDSVSSVETISQLGSISMHGSWVNGVQTAPKPPRIQVVATSSGFKTGINGTNAFDEFSVNNGQCNFKNNKVIEGGSERPATEAEISEIAAFKTKLEEFGVKMQVRMSQYMVELMRGGFKEPNKSQTGENWPMAPEAPCICVKCPNGGIKFVHPQ